MSNAIIETHDLTKVYNSRSGDVKALDHLNLSIRSGEIFGYLGPNGAGKTTTIRLLLDLIRPTNGSASIMGMDSRVSSVEIHRHIGFLPGELGLWKNRTGLQIIEYLARIRGMVDIRHAQEIAERLQLDLSKKVRDYSSGNKRKLGLVTAMMHKPQLLILDEPTGGLDPLMQQIFNQMMRELRDEGRTIFLSSHVLSEVQAICDRVGILRDGQLKTIESIEKLTRVDFRSLEISFATPVPITMVAQVAGLDGASDVSAQDDTLSLKLRGDFDPLLRIITDSYITNIRTADPSLEEIFLTFYGNGSMPQKAVQKEQL